MIFRAAELAQATQGTLQRDGPAGPIVTDTRRIRPGDWFVALVGERFDAHDFLSVADRAECAGVVAQRVPEGWTRGFVQVPDSLAALQDIARFARGEFRGPVVGITGSAGKTTTRAMVALVLEALGRVHQTEGNLNNHIGLPLTIVGAPADADAWVLEMGMNHLREIELLQDIGAPTVRLITNVGQAHTEGVGSLQGVAQAKGELFDGARPGDTICLNTDDPLVAARPIPEGVRVIRYGRSQRCDVRLTDASVDAETLVTRFRVDTPGGTVRGQVASPGIHLASNATAAIAVGVALRVDPNTMGPALGRYAPVGMRLRIETGPLGTRIINDAYNANPLSTEASLRTLAAISGARRVALLGDMLELGEAETKAHRDMLRLATALDLDLVGVAGPRYAHAATALADPDVFTGSDAQALARAVGPHLRSGDVVLLKGSRGLAMERVLKELEA